MTNAPKPLLTMLFALACAAPAGADPMDDYIRDQMRRQHIPGLSVAVVRGGRVRRTAAYGLANLELEVAARPETVFQVQSMTKSFVAVAILMLAEEGKLRLSDPVSRYFDRTPDTWKDITLRHLLNHTSGIKDFINEPTANLRLEVTEEQVLQAALPRPLNFNPGERYAYSNTNYHLLGMVIRKLSGQWYGEFLKERIFDPLEMRDTRIISLEDIIPRRASGYLWNGAAVKNGGYVAVSILGYAGGGIRSTAPDLAKWDLALRSERLLPRARMEEMWTPGTLNNGQKTGYGLGWAISEEQGRRIVSHTGAHFTGFTSAMLRIPEEDFSVYVLTNQRGADPYRLALGIARRSIKRLRPRLPKPARVSPAALARCAGRYEIAPNFMLTIEREGKSLRATNPSGSGEPLVPLSEFEFLGAETGHDYRFEPRDGTPRELIIKRPDRELRGARLGPLIADLPAGSAPDALTARRIRGVLALLGIGGDPVAYSQDMTAGARREYAFGTPALRSLREAELLTVQDAPAGLVRHGGRVARIAYYRLQLADGPVFGLVHLTAEGLFTDLDLVER